MKTVTYKGTQVAINTDLFALIDAKETKKADEQFKAINDRFLADWPEDKRHLLKYAIGREND